MSAVHVVCLKWGTKYGSEYVNRLKQMVDHNLSVPFQFHCMTENPEGIDPSVIIEEIPDLGLAGWWYKLVIFQKNFLNIPEGDKILFLDLDIVIIGSLDNLVTYSDDFCISSNIAGTGYNSSIMCFQAGKYPFIWESFWAQRESIMADMHGDQDWVEHVFRDAVVFPKTLIKSFKGDMEAQTPYSFGGLGKALRKRFPALRPRTEVPFPDGTSIVLFHGKPDPQDVMDGPYDKYRQASWIKQAYRAGN